MTHRSVPMLLAAAALCATATVHSEPATKTLDFFEQQYAAYYADAEVTVAMPPADTKMGGQGDIYHVNNRMVDGDPREGEVKPLGVVRRSCTRLDAKAMVEKPADPFRDLQRESLCVMAFVFEGRGQLVAEGYMDENSFEGGETATLAVTGGTGEFIGAKGEATLELLQLPGLLIKTRIELLP